MDRSWQRIVILPGPRVPLDPPLQTPVGVGQIAFAPDGKSLATVERVQSGSGLSPPEDWVQLWDTTTWRVRQHLREPLWEQKSIAFAPDSRRLAVAGGWMYRGDVLLWDFADGRVRSLASEQETEASSVAYDPRGRWVAFANGGDASFVDVRSGKEILSVKPKGAFQEIAISPNSALLAATQSDLLYASRVEVWRLPASLRGGSVLARVDATVIRLGVMPALPGNGSMHP